MRSKQVWHLNMTVVVALFSVSFFSSCKKDKVVINNQLVGSWRNITSSYTANQGYYLFTADKKLYRLTYGSDDYQKTEFAVYSSTGNQIFIQDPADTYNTATAMYNLRFAGDTLFLNNGSADVIKLLKDKLAPATITDWARPVTVLDKFADTARASTIAYKSGKLFTFKYYTTGGAKLIQYDPVVRNVSALIPSDFGYTGLDFDNDGTLWCVSGQYVYTFSLVTNTFSFQSPIITPSNYLWALAAGDGRLYNYASAAYIDYNTADNTWTGNKQIDNDVTDLAYADSYLYVSKGGMIHKMHPGYKTPTDAWYLEGYKVRGIAHLEGTKFWITAINSTTDKWEMLKVTLE